MTKCTRVSQSAIYNLPSSDIRSVFQIEREYQCLGQWEENGLVYTYTKRQDVGTYECFVGGILSDNKIYIKEAGEHCQRHVNPFRYGMELNKVGKIFEHRDLNHYAQLIV